MTGKSQPPSFGSIVEFFKFLERFDVTEAFKTKGDLRRWSAKRTIGGLIASTACYDIVQNGMSWQAVVLCFISILPLLASFKEQT
jgi:hypothetical protein